MHFTINHLTLSSYADPHGEPPSSFDPAVELFGIADLTRIAQKKLGHSWTSLIKVEGLFVSYIVTHFDIVNSESLVQRYIQLFLHWTK